MCGGSLPSRICHVVCGGLHEPAALAANRAIAFFAAYAVTEGSPFANVSSDDGAFPTAGRTFATAVPGQSFAACTWN